MTYLWPDGQPITVEVDGLDMPHQFTWQGRVHPVQGIANYWRVDEDWWRGRICRNYFKLYTRTGLLAVLFKDLLNGRWYLERLYD
ncbi:MAG: hypothetical protein IT323_18610 [Anaerolineae bacterium]|nr:hypothetical protein [Anaerolineae bacterium]